jgi:hypothetical protein
MQRESHPNQEMTSQKPTSIWRRRWLLWVGGILLVSAALLAILVDVLAHRVEPFVRAVLVETLAERFHARVELDRFHVSLGNSLRGEWGVWAQGRGLRIWPPAQVEGVTVPLPQAKVEPLISLEEFRFHMPLPYRSGTPVHITQVRLRGLEIHFPPRSHFQNATSAPSVAGTPSSGAGSWGVRFQVDAIECTRAQVQLGTDKPDKLPLEFDISHFTVKDIVPGAAMNFEAEVSNPRPPGAIHAKGSFGPWSVADPGESPIKGVYRFDHADLSVFKGIAGILSSSGNYSGTLRDMTVDGETDTPDFQLTKFGHKMELRTTFHAKVDGTNGDTWLDPVDATLGNSHFTAQGPIVRVLASDGVRLHSIGHDIALTVNVGRARIEDFLRLATDSTAPFLIGEVTMKALLHIPPGKESVHERINLKGRFTLDEAEFTNASVQNRIRSLSLRGQGRTKELKNDDTEKIKSRMDGEFDLRGGVLKLPSVSYNVPGADIHLRGTYYSKDDHLDFVGTAKMQATISQMVGGWKGTLLKPADRFFKKDGAGAVIPIFISGTRAKPEFGYDSKHLKSTRPERPGQQ